MKDYKEELRNYLNQVSSRNTDSLDNIIVQTKSSKYICIFGAGVTALKTIEAWEKRGGRKIDFICDNDPKKWGKKVKGIECVSFEALKTYMSETAVIIATKYIKEYICS